MSDLMRSEDGRVRCCLCFNYFTVAELSLGPGGTPTDLCRRCSTAEAIWLAAATSAWKATHEQDGEISDYAGHWRTLDRATKRGYLDLAVDLALDLGLYAAESFNGPPAAPAADTTEGTDPD